MRGSERWKTGEKWEGDLSKRGRRKEEIGERRQTGEKGATKVTKRKNGTEKEIIDMGAKEQQKRGSQERSRKRERKRRNGRDIRGLDDTKEKKGHNAKSARGGKAGIERN